MNRNILLSIFVSLLFISAGCDNGNPNGPTDPTVIALVKLVNDHRADIGCQKMAWDSTLAEVAVAHSQEMNEHNYLSHTDLDGKSPFQRMDDANIRFADAAENLALNDQGAQSTFDAWMASAGHKANIENCNYEFHAVGLSGGYWTHMMYKKFN